MKTDRTEVCKTTLSAPRLTKKVLNRCLIRAGLTDFYSRQDGNAVTVRVPVDNQYRAMHLIHSAGFEWIRKEDAFITGEWVTTFKVACTRTWF